MEQDDEFFPAPDGQDAGARRRPSRRTRGVAVLAAGLVAGGALAGAASAFGSGGSSSSANPTSSEAPSGAPFGAMPPEGTRPTPPADKATALTGSAATQAIAAASKAVSGGTVVGVESDPSGSGYDVQIKKSDGTHVRVELDKNFKVTETDTGPGRGPGGGPGGPGGPGGHGPGGWGPAGKEAPAPKASASS